MTALDVLADPVRRRLCEHLRPGEVTAGALVALINKEFGISQPATSRHLRLLREAGVVAVRKDAATWWYSLDRTALAHAAAWFEQFAAPSTPALDALATEVARGKRAQRTTAARDPKTSETSTTAKEHTA